MADTELVQPRCRAIEAADLDGVVECFARNFPTRSRDYWRRGLAAMGARPAIAGLPRWGHLLEADGAVVGVLLLISSPREGPDGEILRANLSGWCVEGPYRAFAVVMHRRSVNRADVTYVNISPAPHTRKTIEALGFRRYADGQMFFAPLFSRGAPGARIVEFSAGATEAARLSLFERQILADHAALGCRALIGVSDGAVAPFVLQWRTVWRAVLPGAHVIYARSPRELAAFARALGLYCARHGRLFLAVDANGPIDGLAGKFFADREPRYFKGPQPPSPTDLAYTELVIFGR